MTQNSSKSFISSAGLSDDASEILINNLMPMTVQGAQGAGAGSLNGDSATVYLRIIDRSASMDDVGSALRDAANMQLRALAASKDGDSILMSTWLFNEKSTLLHTFVPLANAILLNQSNYAPSGTTALFNATLDGLTSLVAYVQQLLSSGVTVKVVVVIFTDGEDNAHRATANEVKTVIDGLTQQEIYTIACVAFGADGKKIASAMGIRDANLLDTGATEHDIRVALDTTSKSVINVSQNIVSPNSSGGFFS